METGNGNETSGSGTDGELAVSEREAELLGQRVSTARRLGREHGRALEDVVLDADGVLARDTGEDPGYWYIPLVVGAYERGLNEAADPNLCGGGGIGSDTRT